MVNDVSAILVAMMIFLPGMPFLFGGGAGSNIFYYIAGGRELYKGMTFTGPQESAYF